MPDKKSRVLGEGRRRFPTSSMMSPGNPLKLPCGRDSFHSPGCSGICKRNLSSFAAGSAIFFSRILPCSRTNRESSGKSVHDFECKKGDARLVAIVPSSKKETPNKIGQNRDSKNTAGRTTHKQRMDAHSGRGARGQTRHPRTKDKPARNKGRSWKNRAILEIRTAEGGKVTPRFRSYRPEAGFRSIFVRRRV